MNIGLTMVFLGALNIASALLPPHQTTLDVICASVGTALVFIGAIKLAFDWDNKE